MAPDNQKLEELRNKILSDLTGMSEQLITNDDVGFEALLALARSTGNASFLEKALQKAEALEDTTSKADALLDLLDEVEVALNQPAPDDSDQDDDEAAEGAASSENSENPDQQ